jgi:HK97 family phage major capsid protein
MSKQLEQKKRDHHKLTAEAKKIQETYRGQNMPEDEGKEFKRLTVEALELQTEIDEMERDEELKKLERFGNTVPPGATPIPASPDERKDVALPSEVVGYITPGQAVIESKGFNDWVLAGKPKGASASYAFDGSFFGPSSMIPLSRKAFQERQKAIEEKALPTLSVTNATTHSVIAPQRVTEIILANEFQRTMIRDLVTVAGTTSNLIEFVRKTGALPTAATTVSDALTGGSTKPESTLAAEVATVPVRTLAVWMPVTEQQLEDFPQLRDMIDQDLRFDIAWLEEYQMIWGDGTGTDLLGIMETPNVTEFTRTPEMGAGTTVTLLDQIRGAMTDVQLSALEPDGVVMHPIDFETLVLQKGTDDHYLRQIFPTEDGTQRVFSLRIVPTIAAESYRDGLGTHQRVVIVGAFRPGAKLWDRHQTRVEVGYIDKQFIQNTRTIRAEERVGFGVVRPLGFKFIETVAASAS